MNKDLSDYCKIITGNWTSHDRFYLMTDALACWFLHEIESGESPWSCYPFVRSNEKVTFESWVKRLRSSKRMRNDDVTLIHVEAVK